ncbi:cytosine/adenosine deaminase [Lacticaseibacillus paracasei subsp. paracasei Lpp123]|uniref:Cytosine/adenosine deaminase n=1 Tax=Lacticaseibacillus paracasei subsp. paracasei Lpp123 TaxID=1256201 RepID=A0A829GA72_LACPA|nr:cytosine/adenosine deaminase [Lacticaseibacillus paracasei subsp. paracasei Lpp123]
MADTRFNHQVAVVSGIKADESATLLQTFFRTIRAKRKAAKRAGQTSENQL